MQTLILPGLNGQQVRPGLNCDLIAARLPIVLGKTKYHCSKSYLQVRVISESLGLEDSQGSPHWDPASFKGLCHWASTCIAVKWVRDLCLAHQGIRIYRFFKLVSKARRLLSLSIKKNQNYKHRQQMMNGCYRPQKKGALWRGFLKKY